MYGSWRLGHAWTGYKRHPAQFDPTYTSPQYIELVPYVIPLTLDLKYEVRDAAQ